MKTNYLYSAVLLVMALFLQAGCQELTHKHHDGAVVALNGQYIYQTTLDSLTFGLNAEDSLRVAEQYISRWAKDILMAEEAGSGADAEIERMVANYRRTLYVRAYEQIIIEQRMPKTVADSVIEQIYSLADDRLLLRESLVKGMLVIVPKAAPNASKLRQWLKQPDEHMDEIEKFAYKFASGYQLFTDNWRPASDLLLVMPFERNELDEQLRKSELIELSDSTRTYLLRVTDKCMQGEKMPLEYARPIITEYVLSTRQTEFLQKERERLYNEAIQAKKIVFL